MSEFGTYLKPFAADSLWNSVPLNPAFGSYQIPKVSTGWFPSNSGGSGERGGNRTRLNQPGLEPSSGYLRSHLRRPKGTISHIFAYVGWPVVGSAAPQPPGSGAQAIGASSMSLPEFGPPHVQ